MGNKSIAKSLENKGLTAIRGGYQFSIICLITLALIIISAKIRYRSGEIDYLDSDASWHALYTILKPDISARNSSWVICATSSCVRGH